MFNLCKKEDYDLIQPINSVQFHPKKNQKNRTNYRFLAQNLQELIRNSQIFRLRHDGKPTRTRLKIGTAALLVRRRSNQSGQSSLHQISFYSTNPHQRVRHCRSPEIQAPARLMKRRRLVTAIPQILVQRATERARVRRRRAHTHLLTMTRDFNIRVTVRFPHRYRTAGRGRAVAEGESHRRRRLSRVPVHPHTRGRRRACEEI